MTTEDELVRTILRPVRGCATDSQYCDAYDRVITALTTARREAREEAFRDAIGAARSVILPPPLRETRNLIVEAIEAVEATQKGDTDG